MTSIVRSDDCLQLTTKRRRSDADQAAEQGASVDRHCSCGPYNSFSLTTESPPPARETRLDAANMVPRAACRGAKRIGRETKQECLAPYGRLRKIVQREHL